MANIYDMADTWNDSGTVFTAIKMNVTDTASDSSSLLMDLQVGGTSQISASKGGLFTANELAAPLFKTTAAGGYGTLHINGTTSASHYSIVSGLLQARADTGFGWSNSGGHAGSALTLAIYRDADDTLAQRRGTNPQEFRLYNTYTNSTDYERGFMRWNSNVLEIGTESDGTGTDRTIQLVKDGTTVFRVVADKNFRCTRSLIVSASILNDSPGTCDLGSHDYPFRDVLLRPSSSLTPSSNGDLCIEATNDTTLTFKLKGSDGTVRSGTVTLA